MTKLEQAKQAYTVSKETALKMVAKFPQLGKEKDAIKLAVDCLNNPAFYRQLGKNVEQCITDGIRAMETKYRWA